MSRTHTRGVVFTAVGVLVALAARMPRPLGAQQDTLRGAARLASTRRLSLDDALRAAEVQSEAVQIARAGLTRAKGQWYQARSQYLPQLSAVLSYQRTLRSQFQGVSLGGSPDTSTTPKPQSVCAPSIPANATQAQVQAALAQASTCQAATGGFNFSSVGFGAPNSWTAGINFSQNVFAGGRKNSDLDHYVSGTIEIRGEHLFHLRRRNQRRSDRIIRPFLVHGVAIGVRPRTDARRGSHEDQRAHDEGKNGFFHRLPPHLRLYTGSTTAFPVCSFQT